jgi:tetratricopeptide (TPR) repeat protein
MKKLTVLLSAFIFPLSLLHAQLDDNIKNGEDAYKAKNYTKAEAYFSAYIHSFQNNVAHYLQQMHGYDTANTYQKQTTFANFKINHEWAQAYYDRAMTYKRLSYPDNVARDIDMALKIDPGYAEAYYEQSKLKKEKGDKTGACACLGKAIEYSDTMQAAKLEYSNNFCFTAGLEFYKKGKEKMELKEYAEALPNLDMATLICPDSANYFVCRAMAFDGLGKTDSALLDYNHAVKTDPTNFSALYNRGLHFEQQQKYKEAFDDYSSALKFNPNSIDGHLHRAAVSENMQMEASAIYDYKQIIRIKPDVGIAYFHIAQYWHKIGQTDKACEYFQKALDLGVEDAQEGVDDCKAAAAKILTK